MAYGSSTNVKGRGSMVPIIFYDPWCSRPVLMAVANGTRAQKTTLLHAYGLAEGPNFRKSATRRLLPIEKGRQG
jgi:hypothetical protein